MLSTERKFRVTLLFSIIIQVLVTFVAAVMIERMGPDLDKMFDKNARFLLANQELFEILALDKELQEPNKDERFYKAIKQLGRQLEKQGHLINRLNTLAPEVLAQNEQAKFDFIESLQYLSDSHRREMTEVEQHLSFLRISGSWTVVIIGIMAVLISIFLFRKMKKQLVKPIEDLYHGLSDWTKGNRMRRLRSSSDAGPEIQYAMKSINDILDHHVR